MQCAGQWDPKTRKQMTADSCIPMKNGDCANSCPVFCNEGDMMCSGGKNFLILFQKLKYFIVHSVGTDDFGCKMPDFCHHGEFCPVKCGKDEMTCPGDYDMETGKQIMADYCMSSKYTGAKGEGSFLSVFLSLKVPLLII